MKHCRIVVIGASAGGVKALQDLLQWMPSNLNVAFVVVMHIGRMMNVDYPLIYGSVYEGTILEVNDKMPVQADHIYFAPAEYHVSIEKDCTLSLSQDEPVHFARPSIDVLFSSAAHSLGKNACGVLLTGGNQDGASGLNQISVAGGYTLVQDPKEAEYSLMPMSALELFRPNAILPLKEIAMKITDWAGKR